MWQPTSDANGLPLAVAEISVHRPITIPARIVTLPVTTTGWRLPQVMNP
jgi:hypothetical protein